MFTYLYKEDPIVLSPRNYAVLRFGKRTLTTGKRSFYIKAVAVSDKIAGVR